MYRKLTCLLTLLVLFLAGFGSAEASIRQRKARNNNQPDTRPRSPLMFGVRSGIVMGGGATVKTGSGPGWKADLKAGESFGGFVELPSPQWTTAAAELNLHHVRPANMLPAFYETRWMFEIGITLKPTLRKSSAVTAVRPVLGIGYARMAGEKGVASAANLMTVKLGAEGDFFFSPRTGLLVELLATAAPYGRASADGGSAGDQSVLRYSLSTGLRPLIRIGIIFR